MKGFKFAGITAGIKKKGGLDLGLIFCEKPASAAAVFTKNKVVAAPVVLGKEKIKTGRLQAILVNSGNANCFTGKKGMQDAVSCCKLTARALDIDEKLVIVSSTGVIGQPLAMDKFEAGIPKVVQALDETGQNDFAAAILTTDTCTKITQEHGKAGKKTFTIKGFAKGSGMIRPDMATMLAFIVTDADISPEQLRISLTQAVQFSFNRISVDGDTSTNDSLFALASGMGEARISNDADLAAFQACLDKVCKSLAKKIVRDGEGATKLVKIIVNQAKTKTDAYQIAQTIAHSNLVKTAIYGQDPNWGRIIAAAGRSDAQMDPDKVDLFFDDISLVIKGKWLGIGAEKKAADILEKEEITITLDLNLGRENDFFYFCDFSENYVRINADYRT